MPDRNIISSDVERNYNEDTERWVKCLVEGPLFALATGIGICFNRLFGAPRPYDEGLDERDFDYGQGGNCGI